jgi:hypothetical protein
MSHGKIPVAAERYHGIEIDGIAYVPEPPKWLIEATVDQNKKPGALT